MLSPQDWNKRYARCANAYGVEANSFLVEIARQHVLPGSRVLLLGAGEGRNGKWLQSELQCKCLAVDWSDVAVARCRRLGLDAMTADATELTSVGQFDAVVCIFCAPVARAKMLSDAAARLRPGGVAIVELFAATEDDGVGPSAERCCDAATLAAELGGEVIMSRNVRRIVLEGTYHSSTKPRLVAQVVVRARKVALTFRAAMDSFFDSDDFTRSQPEQDSMLESAAAIASAAVKYSRATGRCRYCWAPICRCQPVGDAWASRVLVLCHPNEFLRSTSTGRLLASVCGARFSMWPLPEQHQELHVLYPSEDATELPPFDDGRLLVVPDGSWKQTEAMVASLRLRISRLICYRLPPGAHRSPVLDALHQGAGRGRLSTFEAVALALKVPPSTARRTLAPFCDAITRRRRPSDPIHVQPGALEALRQSARLCPPLPGAARFCSLCDITLASPDRMRAHCAGKRHCMNVAKCAAQANLVVDEHNAARLFQIYSSNAIANQPPAHIEPPDAAVALILHGVHTSADPGL